MALSALEIAVFSPGTIRDNAHNAVSETSRNTLKRLQKFTADSPPLDDRTLILIKAI